MTNHPRRAGRRKHQRAKVFSLWTASLIVAVGLSFLLRPMCQALLGDGWLHLAVWAVGSVALGWYSAEAADRIESRWLRT